jgi:hypothetical protein
MLHYIQAAVQQLSIHRVGNKVQNEFYILSDAPVPLHDEVLPGLLMHYFLTPISKSQEVYRFYHPNDDLQLNELYYYARQFFEGQMDFHAMSQAVTKHLYESSSHPKIKAGEVYVVEFTGLEYEGESCNGIGVFKSENKETYLKVLPQEGAFTLEYEPEAININRLDKGCLILNSESEEGYKVWALDQTNKQQDAVYWKDDFLSIRLRHDEYSKTGAYMQAYKQFVEEKIDEGFVMEKADKIELLNRSVQYFKEKETFDQAEFDQEVIGNPDAASLFQNFRQQTFDAVDVPLEDHFEISDQAVKKAQRGYSKVIKLDKNFHIYVHGKREMIERGEDPEKGMSYYKLYFQQES